MNYDDLSPELKEKAKACKDAGELSKLALENGITLTDEELEMWVTVASDAYAEVARNMTANGLMVTPPAGTNIWPLPRMFDSAAAGGMFIGGVC